MPFTVSHAAAFLPFRKLKLVWSAFIIGSMAPDFPYIVTTSHYRNLGHSFPGVVFFTVPAGLLAVWLFHNFVKCPVIGLLPWGMQVRLRPHAGDFRFGGIGRFAAILGSLLVGIATHLVWDSFTHSFTWPWRHIRWLHQRVHVPLLGDVPGYSLAQHSSTLLGIVALAVWVWLWYRRSTLAVTDAPEARMQSRLGFGVAMLTVAFIAGLARALHVIGVPSSRGNAHLFLIIFGVTASALIFWELVLYSVLVSTHQVWTLD